MDRPVLKTALVTRPHTQALKDGRIRPRGVDLAFEEVPAIIQAFRRMVRGLEFDVSEMAITTYLCARAHGKRFTAIPVFPMRAFHHGAIVCNREAGIASPKDLEGRRVGVNRGYTVTTGVWARAILQHEYGVDLERITWVLSGDEHVAEWTPPANVVPLEPGRRMEDLLVAGELPAAIGIQVDAPHVQPLIADAAAAGLAAYHSRGLYPINHTVVVKDELLAAQPGLAADLLEAFEDAKRLAPQPAEGLPLPYGVEPNRAMLEAIIGHAHEQHIIPRRVAVDELFAG